ncbi:SIS domain-containing protein [Dactylosporangium sp. CA-092794]|uniref:SIS domain-containing protein n=1 Tax=Dactylosporangium sp. CA-092794 TaxID=3239929 RepID=UPI003D8EF81C
MNQVMADATLMETLTSRLDQLRPSERKVAELVLHDPTAVMRSSMAALARTAGVSEPTVMRFCTGLGFDGFQSFKYALAEVLAIGIPVTHSAIQPDDPVAAVATKIFDHTLSSLDRTRRSLDTGAVEEAVDLLLGASAVLFVGLGASGIIAQDALQQAVLFGVPCAAPVDLHQQFMAASMCQPGNVLVAISNTGRTTSVLDVAQEGKRRGATVIGVTGGPGPLFDIADVAIVLRTFEDTDIYTPTVSRLAGLVLFDVMATAVAVRRGPEHLARLGEMKEALSKFRGSSEPGRPPETPATP